MQWRIGLVLPKTKSNQIIRVLFHLIFAGEALAWVFISSILSRA